MTDPATLHIRIHIASAVDGGWIRIEGDAPIGSDRECYALPSSAPRGRFWSKKLGKHVPEGRGLIWSLAT